MKALLLDGALKLVDQRPKPAIVGGEALIRPSLVGICKTDLELVRGYMDYRGVLGHEFVGVVEEASESGWIGKRVVGEINCSPGDRVLADPRHQKGRTVLGILGRDGVMAEFFSLPLQNLLEVPDSLPDECAVFAEPLAAAFQLREQLKTIPSQCLVLGDGKLGALCALALKDAGSEVTWMGKHRSKLSKLEGQLRTALVDSDESRDFPLVVEATGSPSGLAEALKRVATKGTIVLKTTVAAPHQLDLSRIVIDEIQLLGSRCGRFAPALAALAQGRIDPRFLIEQCYPLEKALEAFEHAGRRGVGKILLNCRA